MFNIEFITLSTFSIYNDFKTGLTMLSVKVWKQLKLYLNKINSDLIITKAHKVGDKKIDFQKL